MSTHTRYGTSYFPSYSHAIAYYRPYLGCEYADRRTGLSRILEANTDSLVNEKLKQGEIFIGKPTFKPGDMLTVEDHRYFISSQS
jgi:hypothetical protein